MPSQYTQVSTLKTLPASQGDSPSICWDRQVIRNTVIMPDGSTKLVTIRSTRQIPVSYNWVGQPVAAG